MLLNLHSMVYHAIRCEEAFTCAMRWEPELIYHVSVTMFLLPVTKTIPYDVEETTASIIDDDEFRFFFYLLPSISRYAEKTTFSKNDVYSNPFLMMLLADSIDCIIGFPVTCYQIFPEDITTFSEKMTQ